jgi:hypothetical protein
MGHQLSYHTYKQHATQHRYWASVAGAMCRWGKDELTIQFLDNAGKGNRQYKFLDIERK